MIGKKNFEVKAGERPYMTEPVIFHGEATKFVNPVKGICRTIVDNTSRIHRFPGIANPEIVLHLLEGNKKGLLPFVRYRTEFELQPDGRHLMIWQIQPDGRYWADEDGFGMENEPEIRLYTYLDAKGRFTAPFRIYNVGRQEYFGTDREERLVQERKSRQYSPFEKRRE